MIAIKETQFKIPNQTSFYKGKVRDVYTIANKFMVMVVSDRISAFDVVLPRAIPFKGQILNQIAAKSLRQTEDIIPNWLIEVPDPNVSIGKICQPFKVEMVIRGYLSGHVWREYQAGKRILCGEILPEGLKENDKLPNPIITPTTKASVGHDEDISREEIIRQNFIGEEEYSKLESYTRALYQRGTEIAAKQGLILVDTKYEFGKHGEEITLLDEIHTPDSSRYFYSDSYQELQNNNQPQKQLSKEFVRQWLIENGFQGKIGQHIPEMTDERVNAISERYIELFEHITGEKFIYPNKDDPILRIENNILKSLKKLEQ
jgi:phosphoribosylaminoimidazole-succinocarboxamide synthase